MKLFTCDKCNSLLYFENKLCLKCNHSLGFDPDKLDLITVRPTKTESVFRDVGSKAEYRFCENAVHGVCNWLTSGKSETGFCVACQLNRTIPSLHSEQNVTLWKRIEVAKHRLVYSLLRLKLPVRRQKETGDGGLLFDFLESFGQATSVMTGHANGLITLNIEEADEGKRVLNKLDLGEKYRTLLGHFRHEIGHYYWEVLIKPEEARLKQFRNLFGDESADYGEALKSYYASGPAADWADHFISPYATSHPWEDWAESWAHYLHMMDTLETAYYFGLNVHPEKRTGAKNIKSGVDRDPYSLSDFKEVFNTWLPITYAVNNLNRSMGHPDFYPFVIPPDVVKKLQFIHEVCGQKYTGKNQTTKPSAGVLPTNK